MSTELSTIIENYKPPQKPRSVKIEVGKVYDLTDGTNVEVSGIRTNGTQLVVYYRRVQKRKLFSSEYTHHYDEIESFKARLMELGSVDSITVHPFKEE